MKNLAFTFGASLVILMSGVSIASAQQRASFVDSCTDVRYAEDGEHAMIAATCARSDGSTNDASVVIKSVENIEGRLSHTRGSNPANFHLSCTNTRIEMGGPSGVTLAASCRTSQGQYLETTTSIWDVLNDEGNLKYPY